ncbi:MAG: hypothetical protein IPK32_07555 [Verrucomicrobiaceae bacterium]|nr:hypothetical protein [Verrucomicrobiaceae bacterium]
MNIEDQLRTLRWRDPPPEFLKQTLERALTESRQRPGVLQPSGAFREQRDSCTRRSPLAWLAFIPRPLRLPLAACWLLALYFKLTTPEAVPQSTLQNYAKLPAITPSQFFAHLEHIESLAHELLEHHYGPTPPL